MICRSHLSGTPFSSLQGCPGRSRLAFAAGIVLGLFLAPAVFAQATYTASRAGDLQLGAGASFGSSNYLTTQVGASLRPPLGGGGESLRGFNVYGSFDFRPHFGVELDFRQTSPSYGNKVYERTYEAGGRFVYPLGRVRPYARATYGRGVFNYPYDIANLAYNLYGLGLGADLPVTQAINLRLDFEHQHWFGFPLSSLAPSFGTIGVAYHFSESGHCLRCAFR